MTANRTGLTLLTVIVAAALAAPMLSPTPAAQQHAGMAYAPPMVPRIVHEGSLRPPFVYPLVLVDRLNRTYRPDTARPVPIVAFSNGRAFSLASGEPWLLLGGDPLGRDILARMLEGGRLSLLVAATAVIVTLLVGTVAGAVAGFVGGRVDSLISGLADFIVVLPMIYAVVTLRAAMPLVMEHSTIFWTMAGMMAVASWPFPARGVRAIVAAERRTGYAEAAYALGGTPLRILLRHVLPAARGHVAVQGLLLFPAFIFAEATLSFLGLGFAEPVASWGVMLKDAGRISAITEAPWLLAPAGAIVLTVIGIHLAVAAPASRHSTAQLTTMR